MTKNTEKHVGFNNRLAAIVGWPVIKVFHLLEFPLAAIQRRVGIKHMPWIFLFPNLAFFGIFVVIPLFINFAFSLTGGAFPRKSCVYRN